MPTRIMAFALFVICLPAWAESTGSLSTGFDYSTGKYGGTTSTSILYIPVTGKIEYDDFFLKLTVPYISVSSAGTAVIRGMGPVRTATATRTTTQSGLGDVVASAGYFLYEDDNLLLDVVGNIKFGTADANKNLGTGENDYFAQLDGFYTLRKTTLFATAGYKVVGAPAGVAVNNIAFGTLGVSQKTGEKTSAGVMLDAAQGSSELSPGIRELSFFVSNKMSKTLKLQASLLKGFSDSSPDYGGSLMVAGSF
ncbi:MAG TPA: hypothetical protein VMV48_09375 [Gallionellaceae bacterium]|nr:hypothetical protein [Gallionellaceae bacterium]